MAGAETIPEIWGNSSLPRARLQGRETYTPVSLGGLIVELRRRCDFNQNDLAEALGKGKNASSISEIEQGKKPVGRDFIEELTDIFNLDGTSRSQLLLAGRFLPSDQDVAKIRKFFGEVGLVEQPLPGFVQDFGGRVIAFNSAFVDLFGLGNHVPRLEATPSYHEMIFDPTLGIRERLSRGWAEYAPQEVASLYVDQVRAGTPGYRWRELLMLRLRRSEEFRQLWEEAEDIGMESLIRKYPFMDGGRRITVDTPDKQQTFALYRSPLPTVDARLKQVNFLPFIP